MKAQKIIGPEQQRLIRQAVASAEGHTSGEIRVFVEDHSADEPLDRAAYLFEELEMQNTEQRNGILFYIAIKDHTYAVIGDAGIHEKVGDAFWEDIRSEMKEYFINGEIAEGIVAGVTHAGQALKEYFPRAGDDVNELPDDIVFGKGDQ